MRRRQFIAGLGSVVAWRAAARGQQAAVPVIGFLHLGSPGGFRDVVAEFREGLKQAGYVEGQNVAIEFRWATFQVGQLAMLANDLVRRQAAVIVVAGGIAPVQAAKSATSTIPIVSVGGFDLVKYGFAGSLNRPGGNITGLTVLSDQLMGKQVGLLHELLPCATTLGYLVGRSGIPPIPLSEDMKNDVLSAASTIGLQVSIVAAFTERAFEAAFATLVERQASALVVGSYPLFTGANREKIVALAAQHKIPAIYGSSIYVRRGGLMSYSAGPITTMFREVAVRYVGPILKGAYPADLPIQQATKFEFVINLKTAKALNLEVPPALLAIADEVIE